MASKNLGIVKPILTMRCKKCGKFFARTHPKDPQELCERCREWKRRNVRTAVGGTRKA